MFEYCGTNAPRAKYIVRLYIVPSTIKYGSSGERLHFVGTYVIEQIFLNGNILYRLSLTDLIRTLRIPILYSQCGNYRRSDNVESRIKLKKLKKGRGNMIYL